MLLVVTAAAFVDNPLWLAEIRKVIIGPLAILVGTRLLSATTKRACMSVATAATGAFVQGIEQTELRCPCAAGGIATVCLEPCTTACFRQTLRLVVTGLVSLQVLLTHLCKEIVLPVCVLWMSAGPVERLLPALSHVCCSNSASLHCVSRGEFSCDQGRLRHHVEDGRRIVPPL